VSSFFESATICVSNAIRDSLIRDYRYPANKTMTIYNAVLLSEFDRPESDGPALRARLGLSSEEFLLVCPARLNAQKGIDVLLLAMAKLLRNGMRCKCIIVGDGPLREQLLEQAQALKLNGHVIFEGFQKDVRPYLQAADAFVLTSHAEGLPLAIVEAMACGLPCVVTNVGGNAEAVHHKVHGLVVPPGSVDHVTDAISYLVTHPQERAQMSRMARARAREAFDMDKKMAEIQHVLFSGLPPD
jgi:glycosyltransferase involved in cell wall biosynthesis